MARQTLIRPSESAVSVAGIPAATKAAPQYPRFSFGRTERVVLTDSSRVRDDVDRVRVVDINPESWQKKVGAEWPRLQVPGYSSEITQWSHTKSIEYTFTIRWHSLVAQRDARNKGQTSVDTTLHLWLQSFTHPTEAGKPPSLLEVYWPRFTWIVGAVTEAPTRYLQWGIDGTPLAYEIDVTLLEIRSMFLDATSYAAFGGIDPRAKPLEDPQAADVLLGPADASAGRIV